MFFGTVATKAIRGHFKLFRPITEAHETQDPQEDPDSFCADVLDRTDIDGLTVISQPIPEIDSLDVQFAEFLAACGAGHDDVEQGILNVSMSPVETFDAGNRS